MQRVVIWAVALKEQLQLLCHRLCVLSALPTTHLSLCLVCVVEHAENDSGELDEVLVTASLLQDSLISARAAEQNIDGALQAHEAAG